jgi:hypothetical protein
MTSPNNRNGYGHGQASEGTLRQVNAAIRELGGRTASDEAWSFICECDDLACFELVPLTLVEFDAHRDGDTGMPILAQHHVNGAPKP